MRVEKKTAVFDWTAQGSSGRGRTQKQTPQPGCLTRLPLLQQRVLQLLLNPKIRQPWATQDQLRKIVMYLTTKRLVMHSKVVKVEFIID